MMSRRALLIAGLLLIVGSSTVLSYPQSNLDDEPMQNDDDFDYSSDDQSAPSPQTKDSTPTSLQRVSKTASVTGILGKDLKLKCDVGTEMLSAENVVVLWYFGNTLIANGKNVVQPNFELDPNFDLTILKASAQDAGSYRCEVVPSRSEVITKVVIAEHSLDAIVPESSTSASSAMACSLMGWTLLGSVMVLLGAGRH
ncbi:uncharacterized protein babos [Drosophila bipectinata]|uniref:uncharacterized protein babos n=1 Tax=Drosophila bipectinata TaxID=42026 RepID=UPI001C8A2749|nr:uncharacterized protein LOC108121277 [Drosophila bipectinata]